MVRERQDDLATRLYPGSSRLDVLVDDALEMHILIDMVDPSVFVQKLDPVDPNSREPWLLNGKDNFVEERIECWLLDLFSHRLYHLVDFLFHFSPAPGLSRPASAHNP